MAKQSDIEKAFRALRAKAKPYSLLWRYYDGDHPLEYSTERLRKVFQNIKTKFVENWCSVIINSILDRLDLTSVSVTNSDPYSVMLAKLWLDTELDLDEEDVHRAALVTGEAFVIAWRNDADNHTEAYYVNPALCHMQYDPENPRKKLWAAKLWQEEDGHRRINIFYPERIERYKTSKTGVPRSYKAFVAMDGGQPLPNAMGKIPIFHFRRERRACISELKNIIPVQAAINKLLADMMVSAECGAYLQRWIISNTDDDLSKTLKNIPGSVWQIPGGDEGGQSSSVGTLAATQLQNFLDAIDDLVSAISAISHTPHHYFFGKGETPSGEALIALEAPLNHKCLAYIKHFRSVWQRVAAFLLELEGKTVDATDMVIEFAKPQTVQPETQAKIRQLSVLSGMPLITILRDEGRTEEQLKQLRKDRENADVALRKYQDEHPEEETEEE